MGINDLIQLFPNKRIKPVDGLAITSEVWETAHEYHRHGERFHTVVYHGWGIVTGLEVIASEPPDTSIFILPGIAVDSQGHTIILPKPVAYDIGSEMEGMLYLLLSHEESLSRPEKGRSQDGAPAYLCDEFSITAREALPASPHVELGRVFRSSRTANFMDAADPFHPGEDELDLRSRRRVQTPRELSIAVCYLGDVEEKISGLGASLLAQTLAHTSSYRLTIHDDVPLAPGIENNALIYLVGEGKFKLNAGQINGLSNYIRHAGGTLLAESLDNKARVAFLDALSAMDIEPAPLPAGHRLLRTPHLFPAPPVGASLNTAPEILHASGVIVSNANYGRLWAGQATGSLSREHLRAAAEWGQNLLAYAASRYRRL